MGAKWYGMVALVLAVVSLTACTSSPVSPPDQGGVEPSITGPGGTAPPGAGGVQPQPSLQEGLTVVSHLNLSAGPDNITDLWAQTAAGGRSYVYLGTSGQPTCEPDTTGVHVVDITDPGSPVRAGFIRSPAGMRVSDVMVARVRTELFSGDILAESVEFCSRQGERPPAGQSPGVVLWDVTDPLNPRPLAPGFSLGFEVHNSFIHQAGERALLLVVEDFGERDFHIVDITDPSAPRELAAQGWRDWFNPQTDQLQLGAFPVPLLHDIWAQSYPASLPNRFYAGKTIAYLSYWDAGLVLLDITDPANPVFLGDSDYLDPDPVSGLSPEGNSHSALPTADGSLVIMGDEDFSPDRQVFRVDTGAFAGEYPALEARFTRPVAEMENGRLTGPVTFVGRACAEDPVPAPRAALAPGEKHIALIERGVCPFDEKISRVAQAGYGGAIVLNQTDAADEIISMGGEPAKGTIPAVMVSRRTAMPVMGMSPESPADTPLPAVGTAGEKVTIGSVFDGWGYARVLDVSNPASIVELGQFVTENVMAQPVPPGMHTIHNIIVDGRLAYISWYADGIRVVDFSDPEKPREIGRFVDAVNGSDFWGVYLLKHPDGSSYILGSDRDTGLWVLKLG